MLYQLMKKAYYLNRREKEYLFSNWEDIMSIIAKTKAPKAKKRRIKNNIVRIHQQDIDTKFSPDDDNYEPYRERGPRSDPFKHDIGKGSFIVKIAANKRLFDPETNDQMLQVLGLMEKFVKVDGDISYDNLALFLYPLRRGARKLTLRPHKIVGLTRRLENISRKFGRSKLDNSVQAEETEGLIRSFRECMSEIKDRLKRGQIKKTAQTDNYQSLLNNIRGLKETWGWNTEEIKSSLMSGQFDFLEESIDEAIAEVFS